MTAFTDSVDGCCCEPETTGSRAPAAAVRERGVVLVVALLLLVVLTVLATTGVATAALELRMAANSRYQQQAFDAAEYGIEQAIRSPGLSTGITYSSPRIFPSSGAPVLVPGTYGDRYSYRLYYDTATPALSAGTVPDPDIRAYHFIVESTGTSGRGATDTHVQGFYVIGLYPAPATLTPPACAPADADPATCEPRRTFWLQRNVD